MPGQLFATSTQGGYTWSPLLTKEVVHAAQPDMKFTQFTAFREQWGRNAGETFLFDKYGNIDTKGADLTETSTIPMHSYRLYQGTATLKERGNAIPWTKKYELLSQTDERRAPVQKLRHDMAKVLDEKCEEQFDACKVRYNAGAATSGSFYTDGTDTTTCTSSLNVYHVKQIIDYMYQTMKAEPYDGSNYMAICSTNAKRGVYDDVEDILKYTKYPANGEFGAYYGCRFVVTNHGLSNTVGNGSAYGEAYFFGGNEAPVLEGEAYAPEILKKESEDFGRSKGLAWYLINAYKIFWEGDPDNNIVKFGSA